MTVKQKNHYPVEPQELMRMRAFLVERWREWRGQRLKPEPATPDYSMCRFTAIFLAKVLNDKFQTDAFEIVGGAPLDLCFRDVKCDGGYFCDDEWQAHYWVTDGSMIIDLTCEQFGGPAVFYGEVGAPQYRPSYLKSALKRHVRDAQKTPAPWLEAWKLLHGSGSQG